MSPTLACIVEQFYCVYVRTYVRLYVHHTVQISDNTSHVELTCICALALDFDRANLDG